MNSVKSIFIVVALGLCLIGTSSCQDKKTVRSQRLVQRFKQPFSISHCPKSKSWSRENGSW